MTYLGKRTAEPFYLEVDAELSISTGFVVCEIKTVRVELQNEARKQLERFDKFAGSGLGPLHLKSVLAIPIRHQIGPQTVSWRRVSLAEILKGEIGARSTLLVDLEDLNVQFCPDERLAPSECRQTEQSRCLADGLEAKVDFEQTKSLRAGLRVDPSEIGKLSVDSDGIRVDGGQPAACSARKVRLRNE